jgi:hypothetical protein
MINSLQEYKETISNILSEVAHRLQEIRSLRRSIQERTKEVVELIITLRYRSDHGTSLNHEPTRTIG